MKHATLLLALVLCHLGCGSSETARQTFPATLRTTVDLSDYQACGVDDPCPGSGQCLVLDLVGGTSSPVCIEAGAACDLVECGENDCLLQESYPARLVCASGSCTGDNCDDPVNN